MSEHTGKSGYTWADPGGYWCTKHGSEAVGRVVYISPNYYCTECLMTAVIDGTLLLTGDDGCTNCAMTLDHGDERYCLGCYDAASENASNACDSCGTDYESVYCSDCAQENWSSECTYCSNEPELSLCYRHIEYIQCRECGVYPESRDTTMLCSNCEADAPAQAAQPVTTDGAAIEFDDGIVIQF